MYSREGYYDLVILMLKSYQWIVSKLGRKMGPVGLAGKQDRLSDYLINVPPKCVRGGAKFVFEKCSRGLGT